MVKVVTGGDVHLHKSKVNKESRVVDLLISLKVINNKTDFSIRYERDLTAFKVKRFYTRTTRSYS